MLLTIDVGNTNITLGVFDGEDLIGTFRITTGIDRTSDEFGVVIGDILRCNGISPDRKIQDVIIASVVPNVMHSLTSGVIKYFHITPVIVGPGIRTGIKIVTENPGRSERTGSWTRPEPSSCTADLCWCWTSARPQPTI